MVRFLQPGVPALVLAPMEGVTDAPMRALQGTAGAFTYSVSEFLRVSSEAIPPKVFRRQVPELARGGRTCTGLPVQVQILGGDPERMARSALTAVQCGAAGVDLNFGCPAPTVNRHDGGATLLKDPLRLRAIVREVRAAVPPELPVSAKLRLGWDDPGSIYENAAMAVEGGASWLCIHARTKVQGYAPPVDWRPIRVLRETLGLPVIANGDIWSLDDFRRCRDETGCLHFMLGRGALARPNLSHEVARELGLPHAQAPGWLELLEGLERHNRDFFGRSTTGTVKHFKQWLRLAQSHGDFAAFDAIKKTVTLTEFFSVLSATPAILTPCK